MKSSFCIDLQRFMLIPTKFPLSPNDPKLHLRREVYKRKNPATSEEITGNTPVGVDGFEPPTLCL